MRKLGFIERAYEIALKNSGFLPHYLTIQRFGEDIENIKRKLIDQTLKDTVEADIQE